MNTIFSKRSVSNIITDFIPTEKTHMSKRFLAVSLLLVLVTACSRPSSAAPSAETIPFTQPMVTDTPTALFNNSVPTQTPSVVTATADGSCPAPAPHVQIGQTVTVQVENWDKLKLRSKPEISSGTEILELAQYSQLEILDGPECAFSAENGDAYWFWKVKVLPSGEIGWVAEGDSSHYYIENSHG
jgi:hypothetical protein